jgi:hypothetical protein
MGLESGIRKKPIPGSGKNLFRIRVQGQKGTGSRIRNTGEKSLISLKFLIF